MTLLIAANALLLILSPLSWFAPLVRAGLLPLFGLNEISLWSGIASLWQTDVFFAVVVIIFAITAPTAKTQGLLLIQLCIMAPTALPLIRVFDKFAMADVFLIALYIAVAKGASFGLVEPAWGLYYFTATILASLCLSIATARSLRH